MATPSEPLVIPAPDVAPAGPVEPSTLATIPAFHIPCLDGIRACAFLLVFAAHVGYDNVIPGGFGVTVFFFLSGYLITTLLRREFARQGGISFRKFYLRRVLRIFPPMYSTLAFAVAMSLIGVGPRGWRLPPLLANMAHVTNYWTISRGFRGLLPGMGILWSLAVEEHFYLIFPAVAALLMRRCSPRGQVTALGLACLAVLAWRCALVYALHSPEGRTYEATDTRIDSILFGCILALYHNPVLDPVLVRRARTKWLMFLASVAVLLFTFLYRAGDFRESFRYSCQGIALLPLFYLAISNPRWPLFSWLDLAPLRAVGILSYTLYLIHFWAINVIRYHEPGLGRLRLLAASGIASLAFAAAMYYAVERPCARLRKRLHD